MTCLLCSRVAVWEVLGLQAQRCCSDHLADRIGYLLGPSGNAHVEVRWAGGDTEPRRLVAA